MLNLLEAALFTQEPLIGSTDCTYEVQYPGYKRVPVAAIDAAAESYNAEITGLSG